MHSAGTEEMASTAQPCQQGTQQFDDRSESPCTTIPASTVSFRVATFLGLRAAIAAVLWAPAPTHSLHSFITNGAVACNAPNRYTVQLERPKDSR